MEITAAQLHVLYSCIMNQQQFIEEFEQYPIRLGATSLIVR